MSVFSPLLQEGFTDIYRSIPLRVTFSLPAKETSVPSPGEVLPSLDDYVIFDTSVVRTLATEVSCFHPTGVSGILILN